MANTDSAGSTLIAALSASIGKNSPQTFVQAALALRSWYRNQILLEQPKLVTYSSADTLEVYGGIKLTRNSLGEMSASMGEQRIPLHYIGVAQLGTWMAVMAAQRIKPVYYAKAKSYIKGLAFPALVESALLSQLLDVDNHLHAKMNVPWWRKKSTTASDGRVLGKILWESGFLDMELFKLGVRVAGFKFTADVYNRCAKNREGLLARSKEAPHMLPWLVSGSSGTMRVHETVWADLKKSFLECGGTPQAWKWLCGQGHTWFRVHKMSPQTVQFFNKLASLQLGKVPHNLQMVNNLIYSQDARHFDVFKAAVIAYKKRKLKVSEFNDSVLIFDYLENDSKAVTKGATWASLMRRQAHWHTEQIWIEASQRQANHGCLAWTPLVQTVKHKNLEAISLNNSDELWEEGRIMRHCVGGYEKVCYGNRSRIFSIRLDTQRVATLEIRIQNGDMFIGQLYGKGNARVNDPSVKNLAKKVLLACKKAPKLKHETNRVLRESNLSLHEDMAELPF